MDSQKAYSAVLASHLMKVWHGPTQDRKIASLLRSSFSYHERPETHPLSSVPRPESSAIVVVPRAHDLHIVGRRSKAHSLLYGPDYRTAVLDFVTWEAVQRRNWPVAFCAAYLSLEVRKLFRSRRAIYPYHT